MKEDKIDSFDARRPGDISIEVSTPTTNIYVLQLGSEVAAGDASISKCHVTRCSLIVFRTSICCLASC